MRKIVSVLALVFVIGFANSAYAQTDEYGGFLRLGIKKVVAEPGGEKRNLVNGWKPGFELGQVVVPGTIFVIGGYFDDNDAIGNVGLETGPRFFKVGVGYLFNNNRHSASTYYGSTTINIKRLYLSSRIGFFNRYADVSVGLQFNVK